MAPGLDEFDVLLEVVLSLVRVYHMWKRHLLGDEQRHSQTKFIVLCISTRAQPIILSRAAMCDLKLNFGLALKWMFCPYFIHRICASIFLVIRV